MKKSNVLKLIGGIGFAVAGVATGVLAIKRVRDVKNCKVDFDLDDDEDYDGEDLDDLDEDEEETQFYDDFPEEDEEDTPTEDDIFIEEGKEEDDDMSELTDEEKFERICGLNPDEVRALLSLKYRDKDLDSMSLSELSSLYAESTC